MFSLLLSKLIPLYGLVLIGYFAGKKLKLQRETIGLLLLYVVAPLVFFSTGLKIKGQSVMLLLPVLYFILAVLISMLVRTLALRFFPSMGRTTSLLSFSAGTGNTGYFGIPVLIATVGEDAVIVAVLCSIGCVVFENTLGFYFTAREEMHARDALQRMVRLPSLYAFALGAILSYSGWGPSQTILDLLMNVRGTYSVLGMMMVGLGLSLTWAAWDGLFITLALVAKLVVWPLVTLLIIHLDNQTLHLFSAQVHRAMLVLSLVPMASNTVVVATVLRVEPEKAALAVLVSTLVALFLIPAAGMYGL